MKVTEKENIDRTNNSEEWGDLAEECTRRADEYFKEQKEQAIAEKMMIEANERAMTSAERVQKFRLKKEAKELSNKYLNGEESVTIEMFISAKSVEYCTKDPNIEDVKFNKSFLAGLSELMANSYPDKSIYPIFDLLKAWKIISTKTLIDRLIN